CKLSPARQRDRLESLKLCLASPAEDFDYRVRLPTVELTLDRELYRVLFDLLREQPLAMAEIVLASGGELTEQHVREACFLTAGMVRPALTMRSPESIASSARFNRVAIRDALAGEEAHALASPVLGSGVPMGTAEVVTYAAITQGGTADAI